MAVCPPLVTEKLSYSSSVPPTDRRCSRLIFARRRSAFMRSSISTSSTGFTIKSSVPMVNAFLTSSADERAVITSTGISLPPPRSSLRKP